MEEKRKSSICLDCKNSVGFCSWSRHLIPIEGWNAEKRKVRSSVGVAETYCVRECPHFEKEPERKVNPVSSRYEYFKKLISGGRKDGKADM